MSETAKRKGPPTKAELITRAVALGIADTAAELENLTVKEIRAVIAGYKALITGQDEPEPITEKEPGPEEPAMVIHNGALMATDDLPTRELKADMFPEGAKMEWVPNNDTHPDISEIKEPNCGHIFRKVREIHKNGNIVVNICNICGWRETVR